jgi:hypothetical protein
LIDLRQLHAGDTDEVEERVVIGDLRLAPDASAGAWIVENTTGPWHTVGSLLPACFAAYAELFHPAYVRVSDREQAGDDARGIRWVDGRMVYEKEVGWAEVARANGRVAHPEMDWVTITGDECFCYGHGSQPGIWDRAPNSGSLPLRHRRELAGLLAQHTDVPDECWFAVWDGFGALPFSTRGIPKMQMPNRPMVLFSGPLTGAATSFEPSPWNQSASLWWPEDRAWCVATDVDLMATYVGGSEACIASVVKNPALEAFPITLDLATTWDKDTVNPPPTRRDR